MENKIRARLSVLPLLLFILTYLGVGLYLQGQGVDYAFYQLSAPVAIIPAIVLAFLLSKDKLNSNINTFIGGVSDQNIITMCLIYLLAGAFSTVATATGGVDAIVNASLSFIPQAFLLPGLFLISGLISTAMGTSMGTVGAVGPIAYSLAQKSGLDISMVAGVVLSGAMFGDNLSIISDTTIAATKTQGCEMRDKFKENFKLSMTAALITLVFLLLNSQVGSEVIAKDYSLILALPYLAILVMALMGLNVFVVLFSGTLFAGIVGFYTGYELTAFTKDIYKGFTGMQEIFLLSMLIGGLSSFIKANGGFEVLATTISKLTKRLAKWNRKIADQLGIILLVSSANACIANNTVSILVVGPIAKKLAKDGDISPKTSASLLDIFACIIQGVLPFGAQALLLGTTFGITPLEVVKSSYYCFALAVVSVVFIFVRSGQYGLNLKKVEQV